MEPDIGVPREGHQLRNEAGRPSRVGDAHPPDFASTLVLTTALALACAGLLMAVVLLVSPPEPVSAAGPYRVEARQGAETALYLATFFVILPVSLLAGPRLANAVANAAGPSGLSAVALLLGCCLAAAVGVVRLVDLAGWHNRSAALLAVMMLWWVGAVAILARASTGREWPALSRLVAATPALWLVGAALLLLALVSVTHAGSPSPLPLLLGVAGVPLALLAAARRRVPHLSREWGTAVDIAACVLLFLAIADLVFITPEEEGRSLVERLKDVTMIYHQSFLLGPANQVVGGAALLVDTSSQYGVGSIYFLAGWFELAPIGYGTLALLDSIVTGLYFVAGYAVLRMSGVSRLLAAATLAVGVVTMVLNLVYPLGGLVQEGPIRFGLPLILILAWAASHRWKRHARVARAAAIGVVAISSLWAMEAFAFTSATLAVVLGFEAYLMPAGRVRWVVRQVGLVVAACVTIHLLFVGLTLAATGELPSWRQYLLILKDFLLGDQADFSYDFAPWSPGLAVAAGYVASAAGLVLLVRMRPDVAVRERPILVTTAGLTAYGVWFFAYFVNRSEPHVLPYCCPPLLLVVALWITLLRRSDRGLPGRATLAAMAAALTLAVLLVTAAWPSIGPRFERSALAHAVPGGKSARGAVDRLWEHFPPFHTGVEDAERLLERHMPGERRSVVLVRSPLDTEILMRSGRANALPLGMPIGDSFVPDPKFPLLRDAVEELRSGRRILLDRGQLAALAEVRRNPNSRLLTGFGRRETTTPLQVRTLREIDRRFRLRQVAADENFVVVELAPRP